MGGNPVVLSGIQPSGMLHIGNYFGALQPWVLKQGEYRNYFCIVDLHAITTRQEPQELQRQTRELAAIYLACGIDLNQSVIFLQSHVRAHVELCWLLMCLTPIGWLNRMTQFKEKSEGKLARSVGAGIFTYPVLMASDILAYQADFVPVGEDQRQHLELTRDIAGRFNSLYSETFRLPEPLIGHTGSGSRIMGLDDPTKKMSKSNPNADHAVKLLDPPDVIKRKIMRAQTDSDQAVNALEAKPGIANLLEIYRAMTGMSLEATSDLLDGTSYRDLKARVADLLVETLTPIQQRSEQLLSDKKYIEQILADGAEKASEVAESTVAVVRSRMGIG